MAELARKETNVAADSLYNANYYFASINALSQTNLLPKNKVSYPRNFFKKIRPVIGKKIIRALLAIITILVVLFLTSPLIKKYLIKNKKTTTSQNVLPSQTLAVNKNFTFPGLDDTAKKKGKIDLKITDVEKTDQVIVQDKQYTAKNNKTFLIVNLELKNESTGRLNIFPGDLMRLIVDDADEKKFAPDLHNNYVLVAPISTKIERVGFVIDKSENNLKLQVGELEGDKEILELKF